MSEAIVIIRPSFKKIVEGDACRAGLFNQFLFWIAGKAKGQEAEKIKSGEVYWYGSAEDIHTGIDQNWSIWKVRKEVDILVKEFIGRRHNQRKGWDREYQYFIGLDQGKAIREACEKYNICLKHLGLNDDVLHLLKTVNAFDENRKCDCPNQPETTDASTENRKCIQGKPQMDVVKTVNAFDENRRAIPKDTTKGSSQGFNPKGTERNDEPPTSQQPNDSSFNSDSDLNLNSQGDATDLPPGVGMSSRSGLRIASQSQNSDISVTSLDISPTNSKNGPLTACPDTANSSGVETLHSDAPRSGQGYKTFGSDESAVMENDTATELQLLDWVKDAGVALGLKASCEKAVATLLPLVHGPEDIQALLKIERKIHPTGIIYIANLAREEVIRAWQSAGQDEYVPSPRGMSPGECSTSIGDIWNYDPDIALSYRQDDHDRWFVAIFIGEGRYKELGSPDDWPKFCSFGLLLSQAVQYGRDLAQQQAVPQREAIAV